MVSFLSKQKQPKFRKHLVPSFGNTNWHSFKNTRSCFLSSYRLCTQCFLSCIRKKRLRLLAYFRNWIISKIFEVLAFWKNCKVSRIYYIFENIVSRIPKFWEHIFSRIQFQSFENTNVSRTHIFENTVSKFREYLCFETHLV